MAERYAHWYSDGSVELYDEEGQQIRLLEPHQLTPQDAARFRAMPDTPWSAQGETRDSRLARAGAGVSQARPETPIPAEPSIGFAPQRRPAPARSAAPTTNPPSFDPRSPFERDLEDLPGSLARSAIDAIPGLAPIRMGMGAAANLPYFRRPQAPAQPAAPAVEETYPIPPDPTVNEMMQAEGVSPTPPAPNPITMDELPDIPLIEEGQLQIDPTLQTRVEQARAREQRFQDITGPRRASIEAQLEKQRNIPRWLQALSVLGAGLSGVSTGRSAELGSRELNRIPEMISGLENQLMQLGLSQEDIVQAREEAELAPVSAQHQLDTQRILANHQVAVADAQQARQLAIQARQQGDQQAFQVWSARLQIALEKLKVNLANIHRAAGVQASLGGAPAAEATIGAVAPLGAGAQGQVADRLARANLQGLLESDMALAGGDAGRAVSLTRQRVNQMFARMGLPPPAINRRVLQNPQAFAEYLIRASNGRILQDPEVRKFEYIPGIAAE